MKTYLTFALFLALNFIALGIGGYFTGPAVASDWYQMLNKAPWTPPGFVFGIAWTTIMICFSFFNVQLLKKTSEAGRKNFWLLYGLQWLLNVAWNPLFFHFHLSGLALLEISMLAALVSYYLYLGWQQIKFNALWVLPYFVWMWIATSLNAYIVWAN